MKPKPDDELIRTSDFESLALAITLKNTTTGGELRRPGAVSLVEFMERGMILEAPARFAQKGHYLVIHVELSIPGMNDKYKFNTGAKVDSSDPAGDGRDILVTSLIQHDAQEWQYFQGLFSARQSEIEEFLKAAKGGV